MALKFEPIASKPIVKACACPDFEPDDIGKRHTLSLLWRGGETLKWMVTDECLVEINKGEKGALQDCSRRKRCANYRGLDCCIIRKFRTDETDKGGQYEENQGAPGHPEIRYAI